MTKVKDEIIGKHFGKWRVISEAEPYHKTGYGYQKRYNCLCDCGREKMVWRRNLLSGASTSCGCSKRGKPKYSQERHEYAISRISDIYGAMKKRCYSPNSVNYNNYGGRGITICDEWLGVDGDLRFYRWSLEHGYSDELSIDRIDNNKGYSPDNCKWSTRQEQNDNKRSSRFITYNGETKTITQWARELGFRKGRVIDMRLKRGWSIEEALTTRSVPPHHIRHKRELEETISNNHKN